LYWRSTLDCVPWQDWIVLIGRIECIRHQERPTLVPLIQGCHSLMPLPTRRDRLRGTPFLGRCSMDLWRRFWIFRICGFALGRPRLSAASACNWMRARCWASWASRGRARAPRRWQFLDCWDPRLRLRGESFGSEEDQNPWMNRLRKNSIRREPGVSPPAQAQQNQRGLYRLRKNAAL